MTVAKYGFENWVRQRTEEDLLDVLQINRLRIALCTQLTDCISNSRLCRKLSPVRLSRAITQERMKWLGNILWMKDGRLPNTVLVGQPLDYGGSNRCNLVKDEPRPIVTKNLVKNWQQEIEQQTLKYHILNMISSCIWRYSFVKNSI